MHGTKFWHPEDPVIPANPVGPVKDWTLGRQFYKDGDKQKGQTTNTKRDKKYQYIKESFQSVIQNSFFCFNSKFKIQNSKFKIAFL